jgi:hypothetical protein
MSLGLVLQIPPGVTPYQKNHSPDLISLKGFNSVRGNPERKEVQSGMILTKIRIPDERVPEKSITVAN